MGALTSAHSQVPQQVDEDINTECTPRHLNKHEKRILNIDPRSPSDNIMRTPIIVDKTPTQLHTPKTQHVESQFLKDPRSPTTQFTRTPLCLGNTQSSSQSSLHNSLSNTPVSHHSFTSESGIESAEVTPVLKMDTRDDNLMSSPDSAINSEMNNVEVLDSDVSLTSPNSHSIASKKEESAVIPEPGDETPLMAKDLQKVHISTNTETTPLVHTDSSSKGQLRLRPYALGKRIDNITEEGKGTRSPLSIVDNSPRYGRLNKSSNKTPGSGMTRPTIDHANKENVCH